MTAKAADEIVAKGSRIAAAMLEVAEEDITPGLGAVANAIVDALAEFGVGHIELPATPERVWRAIRTPRVTGAGAAG